jgi:hypothetical protein
VFADLGAPSIPSSFSIPHVHTGFGNEGILLDESYDRIVVRFFMWYIEALEKQQKIGVPY